MDDEERQHRARLLHFLLWALVLVPVPYLAYYALDQPQGLSRALVQALVGEAANAALLVLLHRGHVRVACALQVTAFWLFMVATAVTGGGPTGQAYQMGLPLTILFAGLLLGFRAGVGVAVASIGAGALMLATGVGAAEDGQASSSVIVSAVLFPMIAVVQYLGYRTLREALARARASEERLRALIDAAFEGIMTHEGGVIRSANATFARLFGYERPEDVVGMNGLHSLLTPESAALISRRLASGGPDPAPFVGVRRDGSTFRGETRSRMLEVDGHAVRVVVVRDVTLEVEREALHDRVARLERLEVVGRLAGGVAHDFNNLLAAVMGNLSLVLDDERVSAQHREALESALAAAEGGGRLTRQLLAIGRRRPADPERIDLRELVERVQGVLAPLLGRGIDLAVRVGEGPRLVTADGGQVEQVVVNLCLNARDAMPEGGHIVISLEEEVVSAEQAGLVPDAQPGTYVVLAVSDEGVGIAPEALPHLFEPFFTTKPEGSGTGLGLASVYGIVRAHSGFVTVESTPDRGTTFRTYWPTSPSPASP